MMVFFLNSNVEYTKDKVSDETFVCFKKAPFKDRPFVQDLDFLHGLRHDMLRIMDVIALNTLVCKEKLLSSGVNLEEVSNLIGLVEEKTTVGESVVNFVSPTQAHIDDHVADIGKTQSGDLEPPVVLNVQSIDFNETSVAQDRNDEHASVDAAVPVSDYFMVKNEVTQNSEANELPAAPVEVDIHAPVTESLLIQDTIIVQNEGSHNSEGKVMPAAQVQSDAQVLSATTENNPMPAEMEDVDETSTESEESGRRSVTSSVQVTEGDFNKDGHSVLSVERYKSGEIKARKFKMEEMNRPLEYILMLASKLQNRLALKEKKKRKQDVSAGSPQKKRRVIIEEDEETEFVDDFDKDVNTSKEEETDLLEHTDDEDDGLGPSKTALAVPPKLKSGIGKKVMFDREKKLRGKKNVGQLKKAVPVQKSLLRHERCNSSDSSDYESSDDIDNKSESNDKTKKLQACSAEEWEKMIDEAEVFVSTYKKTKKKLEPNLQKDCIEKMMEEYKVKDNEEDDGKLQFEEMQFLHRDRMRAFVQKSFKKWNWNSDKQHEAVCTEYKKLALKAKSKSLQSMYNRLRRACVRERQLYTKFLQQEYVCSVPGLLRSVKFVERKKKFFGIVRYLERNPRDESTPIVKEEEIDVEYVWLIDNFGENFVQHVINLSQTMTNFWSVPKDVPFVMNTIPVVKVKFQKSETKEKIDKDRLASLVEEEEKRKAF